MDSRFEEVYVEEEKEQRPHKIELKYLWQNSDLPIKGKQMVFNICLLV